MPGVERAVGGALADPEMQTVGAADQAVAVRALRQDAEGGQCAAVDPGEDLAFVVADVEGFVAPAEPAVLREVAGQGGEGAEKAGLEMDAVLIEAKDRLVPAEDGGEVGLDPADAGRADAQGQPVARENGVAAGLDVAQQFGVHARAYWRRGTFATAPGRAT